jgi:hypothetical protein
MLSRRPSSFVNRLSARGFDCSFMRADSLPSGLARNCEKANEIEGAG